MGQGEETALGFRVGKTVGLGVDLLWERTREELVNTVDNVVGRSVGSAVDTHRS